VGRRSKNRAKKTDQSLKQRWLAWYASVSPVLYFSLKFGVSLALLYVLLSMPFFDRALYSYLEVNAWLANAILHGLGEPTKVSEVTIQSPLFNMRIQRGCDAVEPTWLLCAAMISFPAPILHKLWGMLAAIVLLQILNLIRIITLYWIGIHLPGFFNSAHVELWPVAFIAVAIIFFVAWKEHSLQPKPHVEDKR
jgi:exosortase/archaeosortase family protein